MGAFLRLSGIAAIIGAVSFVIGFNLSVQTDSPYPYLTRVFGLNYLDYGRLSVIPIPLILTGLLGLHVVHRKANLKAEMAGFLLALIGLSMWFVGQVLGFWIGTRGDFHSFNVQTGFELFAIGLILQSIGLLIFGAAAVRAKVLSPRVRGLPILMGLAGLSNIFVPSTPFSYLGFLVSPSLPSALVYGIAWVILGYAVSSFKT